jgi:hypothetical protein
MGGLTALRPIRPVVRFMQSVGELLLKLPGAAVVVRHQNKALLLWLFAVWFAAPDPSVESHYSPRGLPRAARLGRWLLDLLREYPVGCGFFIALVMFLVTNHLYQFYRPPGAELGEELTKEEQLELKLKQLARLKAVAAEQEATRGSEKRKTRKAD